MRSHVNNKPQPLTGHTVSLQQRQGLQRLLSAVVDTVINTYKKVPEEMN